MPTYVYQHGETGRTVEKNVPIDERDTACPPGYARVSVPSSIGWSDLRENPSAIEPRMREALKQMESKYGAREVVRRSTFSVDKLKAVWGI